MDASSQDQRGDEHGSGRVDGVAQQQDPLLRARDGDHHYQDEGAHSVAEARHTTVDTTNASSPPFVISEVIHTGPRDIARHHTRPSSSSHSHSSSSSSSSSSLYSDPSSSPPSSSCSSYGSRDHLHDNHHDNHHHHNNNNDLLHHHAGTNNMDGPRRPRDGPRSEGPATGKHTSFKSYISDDVYASHGGTTTSPMRMDPTSSQSVTERLLSSDERSPSAFVGSPPFGTPSSQGSSNFYDTIATSTLDLGQDPARAAVMRKARMGFPLDSPALRNVDGVGDDDDFDDTDLNDIEAATRRARRQGYGAYRREGDRPAYYQSEEEGGAATAAVVGGGGDGGGGGGGGGVDRDDDTPSNSAYGAFLAPNESHESEVNMRNRVAVLKQQKYGEQGRRLPAVPIFTFIVTMVDILVLAAEIIWNQGFEPLTVNPWLGPSLQTLLQFQAKFSCLMLPPYWQVWRFITPVFVHLGIFHLLLNGSVQVALGYHLEREYGPVRYAFIYIVSGIGGNLLSAIFLPRLIEAGASSALFGIISLYIVDLMAHWEMYVNRWTHFFVFIVGTLFSLVLGLMPYVDNFAHIGGGLVGVFAAMIALPSLFPVSSSDAQSSSHNTSGGGVYITSSSRSRTPVTRNSPIDINGHHAHPTDEDDDLSSLGDGLLNPPRHGRHTARLSDALLTSERRRNQSSSSSSCPSLSSCCGMGLGALRCVWRWGAVAPMTALFRCVGLSHGNTADALMAMRCIGVLGLLVYFSVGFTVFFTRLNIEEDFPWGEYVSCVPMFHWNCSGPAVACPKVLSP